MRIEQPKGIRGSLKWMQRLVEYEPSLLDADLQKAGALPQGSTLHWVSPLAQDSYAEYRDEAFLQRLGLGHLAADLRVFWPRRGPQWDGLATGGGGAVLLFEAKAHAPEMASTCQATGKSLTTITAALLQVQNALGAASKANWLEGYYQYANRLGHLYFLRSRGINAWLVFLYFTQDTEMSGPNSESEWHPHLLNLHDHLGLPEAVPGVASIFVPVQALR